MSWCLNFNNCSREGHDITCNTKPQAKIQSLHFASFIHILTTSSDQIQKFFTSNPISLNPLSLGNHYQNLTFNLILFFIFNVWWVFSFIKCLLKFHIFSVFLPLLWTHYDAVVQFNFPCVLRLLILLA
jgi:hypothetical protein